MFLGISWSVNGVLILKAIVDWYMCSFTLVPVEIKEPRRLYLVWIFFGLLAREKRVLNFGA